MEPRPGGIVAAAGIVSAHRTAIEYDLLTLAGLTLDDLGGALSWSALFSFIRHLPPTSAYFREINPDEAAWASGHRTAGILADIFDLIAAANTPKGKPRPKPYPRPGMKQKTERRIGADPIPASEFMDWWNRKR